MDCLPTIVNIWLDTLHGSRCLDQSCPSIAMTMPTLPSSSHQALSHPIWQWPVPTAAVLHPKVPRFYRYFSYSYQQLPNFTDMKLFFPTRNVWCFPTYSYVPASEPLCLFRYILPISQPPPPDPAPSSCCPDECPFIWKIGTLWYHMPTYDIIVCYMISYYNTMISYNTSYIWFHILYQLYMISYAVIMIW